MIIKTKDCKKCKGTTKHIVYTKVNSQERKIKVVKCQKCGVEIEYW